MKYIIQVMNDDFCYDKSIETNILTDSHIKTLKEIIISEAEIDGVDMKEIMNCDWKVFCMFRGYEKFGN